VSVSPIEPESEIQTLGSPLRSTGCLVVQPLSNVSGRDGLAIVDDGTHGELRKGTVVT